MTLIFPGLSALILPLLAMTLPLPAEATDLGAKSRIGAAVEARLETEPGGGVGTDIITPDATLDLWPAGPPGAPANLPAQHIVHRTNPYRLTDRAVHNVNRPNLGVFAPARPNGGAILIIPGGGYSWVVMDKEGYEGARHFSAQGYRVYVLRYRLPHQGWAAGPDAPLQDAQRAMRLIRSRAADDGIDPKRIMVMGFSAGGHLAGSLALRFDAELAEDRADPVNRVSARPDLAVLMYPVVTMAASLTHAKSRENMLGPAPSAEAVARHSLENQVTPGAPPMFILHAIDDPAVPFDNALLLFNALRRTGVPTALHGFETGGHGFGLRGISGTPLAAWPQMVLDWATSHGFPRPDVVPSGTP